MEFPVSVMILTMEGLASVVRRRSLLRGMLHAVCCPALNELLTTVLLISQTLGLC